MATTVTNAEIDAAALTVAAPYGPFTRVTDVATLPEPNSTLDLEFTGADGNTYTMSYEQLLNADRRLSVISQANPMQFKMDTLIASVEALNTTLQALTPPFTYEEYNDAVQALRNIPEVQGYY